MIYYLRSFLLVAAAVLAGIALRAVFAPGTRGNDYFGGEVLMLGAIVCLLLARELRSC